MKISKFYLLLFVAGFAFLSCDEDDDNVLIGITDYTIAVDASGVNSSYTFDENDNDDDDAEQTAVFSWNDAPQNIQFILEGSGSEDFGSIAYASDLFTGNSFTLSESQLIAFANAIGLDNDANTPEDDEETEDVDESATPNNSGTGYFRIRAVDEFTAAISMSSVIGVDFTLVDLEEDEEAVCEFDQLWVVGAGAPEAGWAWTTPVQVGCSGDGKYSATFILDSDGDGNFRFFTEEGNWGSGRNYPYYADLGYDIDPVLTNAQDGDSNFLFTGTTGTYTVTVDDTNMTISVD